jgi:hypothetical protein
VRGDGGHFFSADNGESWYFQWSHAAYHGVVHYTDGTVGQYKRERPKLVLDPETRVPIALSTGAGVELVDAFQPGDDCACTLVQGINTAQGG